MGGKPRVGSPLQVLREEVAACTVCAADLPLGPRPVIQIGACARVVIIGQAPGTKVHESGVPWDDASGAHLREWLDVSREAFYDENRVALLPMGFCYPGRSGGGDAPPRRECAPLWHERILASFDEPPLVLLVGLHAQRYYLGPDVKPTLTETVRSYSDYLPRFFPLPHPSWRSRLWMKKNLWFEREVLPALRAAL